MTYEPLVEVSQFTIENPEFSGDVITLKGKVFEAGDYPDKNFSITEEELAAAAKNFTPVQNDLEHMPTILSGAIGKLTSVTAKGSELFGEVVMPKWLYEATGKQPIKTSLAWGRDSKTILGNALCLNPRVPDAQLVAAFTAANNDTPRGGKGMNRKWYEKLVEFFTKKELPEGFEDFNPEDVTFSDAEPKEVNNTKEVTKEVTPDKESEARFARQEEELAGLRKAQLQSKAESFFSDMLSAGKVTPAEKQHVEALFVQAVEDDNSGVSCFTAEGAIKEGNRAETLRNCINARPTITLTKEQLKGDLVLLSNGKPDKSKLTPEEKEELLKQGTIKIPKEAK